MDLFEEISKEKEEFPKVHSVTNEVKKYKLNFYQFFAIGFFVVCLFLGIIFGNLFATCQASANFFSEYCAVREFNFSLMIMIWTVSFFISLLVFSIGHIILLLTEINEKLTKFHS